MRDGAKSGLDLRDYLLEMERELTNLVGRQREVLIRFLDEQERQGHSLDHCGLIDCRPLNRYRRALRNAVRVLEETRRSFKSRRLEELRKELEQALAEDAEGGH